MRTDKIIDHLMDKVLDSSKRWCLAKGGCACMGCINGSNGHLGITIEEWEHWKQRHKFCECCMRYNRKEIEGAGL